MLDFFKKTFGRVKSSAGGFIHSLLSPSIDESSIKSIKNIFLASDFGVEVADEIIGEIENNLKKNKELSRENVIHTASMILKKTLQGAEATLDMESQKPQVICLVGTNGSGKTTTAAKLAYFYEKLGQKVLLGACDTFRAAANEQLSSWGEKLSLDVIASQHGADPAAVAFDSYKAAIARGKDILILDTAGRLHVKANLMAELQKIFRVFRKANAQLVLNVWFVADGTLGGNTMEAAKTFHSSVGLSGLIVTKLDGTSSGGALVGIYKNLRIPIYFIGTGETPESLEKFSADKYVAGIFSPNGKRKN
ncbi:MAG: signal recognition particle-docking protein FtsY [Puniceicoccales bacterium]|jgi:fused signal recognition particle receptor|nr:signal recognition particle-docking protein FtsY [Puniceicoccales bacterium]